VKLGGNDICAWPTNKAFRDIDEKCAGLI